MLKHDFIGGISRCTLTDSTGKSFISFLPEFGATPVALSLSLGDKQVQLFDGFQTEEQILTNEKSRGIFLMPFPNRVRDGKYVFEGKKYQLPINKPKENNAIHGFIWNRKFELEEINNIITLTHQYTGDYAGFPFPFLMSIQYALTDGKFSIKIKVTNTAKSSMPLGAGWHPYFTLGEQADELQLQLPHCNHLEVDERLIPTGNRVLFTEFQTYKNIGSRKFDDAFECAGSDKFIETRLRNPKTGMTIIIQQDFAFKYLQIYTPPERNSIAIEPMTCPANALNSGEGLTLLKSGEAFEGKIQIKISA